jgi:hypothetical protein
VLLYGPFEVAYNRSIDGYEAAGKRRLVPEGKEKLLEEKQTGLY